MSINLDLLDLRAFLAILEEGSFIRAANKLNLSSPALSRRIKHLESVIGAQLVERTTRRVSATLVGRKLQPGLARIIDELDSSIMAMSQAGNQRSGVITIASIPTAAWYLLPRVIRQFSAQYPLIRFRIEGTSGNEGLKSVADGHAEFGINSIGSTDPDLRFTHLIDDPFVVVCRHDHTLARMDVVRWKDLAGFPLIGAPRQSSNRTILDNALAKNDFELDWFYEVNHPASSIGFVEAGLGVAVLPTVAIAQGEYPLIVTRPIKEPIVTRSIGIIERRSGRLSPIAASFRHMLIETWRDGMSETGGEIGVRGP